MAPKEKKATRREHFIPQFYLKGFANNKNQVCALNKNDRDGNSIFHTKIKNICLKNDLYEVRLKANVDKGYVERGAIENWLSSFEGRVRNAVVECGKLDLHDGDLFPSNFGDLAAGLQAFIANLIVRHPMWLNSRKEAAEGYAETLQRTGFFSDCDLKKLDELGYRDDIGAIVELGIEHAEICMFAEGSSTWHILNLLNELDIAFLKAPSNSEFITSSFPIAMGWPDAMTDNPSAVYFPICSKTAVMFAEGDGKGGQLICRHLSGENVDQLNTVLLVDSPWWEQAYSKHSEALIRAMEGFTAIATTSC